MLVCGGNLLHFTWGYNKFRHVKCVSRTTEEEAQASFEASESPWFDEVNVSRHKDCYSSALALDLRFLRVCHQIYDEASSFCYTDNTFSFEDWTIFAIFVRTMTRVSYVRSIRSCSEFIGDRPFICKRLQNIFNKLTGLQRIHIDWEQLPGHLRKYDQRVVEAIHPTQQLICFGGIELKTATVIISDAQFYKKGNESHSLHRWTMTQKQEYSRFLRNALLQHRAK